uniref:Uncharacterized protein n=1 Tax=Anopheles christyi TaxID=43041 RepID=A0A182KIW7_9DIPT
MLTIPFTQIVNASTRFSGIKVRSYYTAVLSYRLCISVFFFFANISKEALGSGMQFLLGMINSVLKRYLASPISLHRWSKSS